MTPSETIKTHMVKKVMTLKPDQDVLEAIALFVKNGVSGAPVVNDRGELIGMLSDTDCIKAAVKAGFDPAWRGLVSEFMTKEVDTVSTNTSLMEVAERFMKQRFRRYPVIDDDGLLVGQVSRLDVLRGLNKMDRGYA